MVAFQAERNPDHHPPKKAGEQTHLDKRIHSHDSHIGLTLGVIHQIEIYKFLEFKIVSLHAIDDVRKQGTGQQKRKVTLSLLLRPLSYSGYLDQSANTQNGIVRLSLGIVDQVQINQLLQLQVVRLHAFDDIREKSAVNR